MAEEIRNSSGTPETAQNETSGQASSGNKNADFPTLFENIGLLIDSSIGSIAGMIDSANSVTKQVSENITLTANSDAVKGIVDNIGSLSQNVIQGVNDTLNSEQLKKTFDELGKLATSVLDSAGSVANSEQAQNLFTTVNTGLNQLLQTIVSPVQSGAAAMQAKKAIEIPFCHKTPCAPSDASPEPEKKATPAPQITASEPAQAATKKEEPVKQTTQAKESQSASAVTRENPSLKPKYTEKKQHDNNDKSRAKDRSGYKKEDPSRKGTIPRQK
ncbi:MAG: hypothetical protein OQK61_04625 [Ignavibacteriaceae bacterium]|nr:hypothetical protein [Ignavibacteriaceae bacterium]